MSRFLSLLLFLSLTVSGSLAQPVFRIDSLPAKGILLDKGWKFHTGDNPDWSKPEFDDSQWESIDPTQDVMDLPQIQDGKIGWLRLRIDLDSSLLPQPLALGISQVVASEIYIDGHLLKQFGELNSEQIKAAYLWKQSISLPKSNPHLVIVVRFAFQKGLVYNRFANMESPCFSAWVLPIKEIENRSYIFKEQIMFAFAKTGAFFVLFILHLAFFAFYPTQKTNLYFSGMALCYAIHTFMWGLFLLVLPIENLPLLMYSGIVRVLVYSIAYLLLLRALYSVFNFKIDIIFWLVAGGSILLLVVYLVDYKEGVDTSETWTTNLNTVASLYIAIRAVWAKKRNSQLILIGMVVSIIGLGFRFFVEKSGLVPELINSSLMFLFDFIGVISIPICISWFLGGDFAFTNRNLVAKLNEVRLLSFEKQQILANQNETLEAQVQERTAELADKNRELVIEAALEKIRSRSLGMHHSVEIKDVVAILFEKSKELNLVFDGGAAIHLFTEGSKNAVIWVASPDLAEPFCNQLPYDEHAFENNPIILDVWHAKETGQSIYNKFYSFNEKNRYFDYVFRNNDFITIPQPLREFIYQTDSYTASFIAEKNSLLGATSWTRQIFSNDDLDVLKRIARVFEQAYIRFLDLQKVEAQAREAKIEAALERVRARSMAMQHSDELPEAATLLFQQVQALGIPSWSCGFNIWQKEEKVCTGWMSTKGFLQPPFQIPLTESPTFIHFYESRQKGESFYVEEVGGEALVAHYAYMRKLPIFGQILEGHLQAGVTLPAAQIHHVVNFSHGNLIFITHAPVPEAWDIFKRFAQVFDQTYTRFLDLQKAEIQALTLREEKQRLEHTLTELRMTQTQLIQKEKMASLGELTAGIAHEIQNPLNFVNNFSEVSTELVSELEEEQQKPTRDTELEADLLGDLKQNLQKITHHGNRASSIVKGMLEHSRTSTDERQPFDLNALADEYLRLAYQGLRAKDKSFNAELKTEFDPNLGQVELVPQEIARVLLNLYNNAFYAVGQKQKTAPSEYQPTVSISTQRSESGVEIRVRDNGMGISDRVKDKIFQPFFTTKPTGEGTGLGLSLSYDIVTKGHGGEIKMESLENLYTELVITLPLAKPA